MAGEYDKVISLAPESLPEKSPEARKSVSWAHVKLGLESAKQARGKTGAEAERLFAQAGGKYRAALEFKPDMHEALYNWGLALSDQAKGRTAEEADRLFARAGEKYQAALEIKPDVHEALHNWGNTLLSQAKGNTVAEADRLFAQAGEKYRAALEIKPDKHKALYNWGNALLSQAEGKSGADAERLFAQAGEKYQAALEIKPDKHEALYNWGNALLSQAEGKSGADAERLFAQAGEKYQAALEIKPDKHEALYNWGNALLSQAKGKTGEEAERSRRLLQSRRVPEEAGGFGRCHPGLSESAGDQAGLSGCATTTLGTVLSGQARGKTGGFGSVPSRLYRESGLRSIKPNDGRSFIARSRRCRSEEAGGFGSAFRSRPIGRALEIGSRTIQTFIAISACP